MNFDDWCDTHGIHGARKEALHRHIMATCDGDAVNDLEEWELARQKMEIGGATPEQIANLQRVAADFLTEKASGLVNAWWNEVKAKDLPLPLGLARLVLQVLTELVNCTVAFYTQGYNDAQNGEPRVLPSGHVMEIGLVEMSETSIEELEGEGEIRACPECGEPMIQAKPGVWKHLQTFGLGKSDKPADPEEVEEWLQRAMRQMGKAPLN